MKKDFKILIIYANSFMDTLIPLSVTVLASHLINAGFCVNIFDTTFYDTESNPEKEKAKSGQIKSFDDSFFPVYYDIHSDFEKKVDEFKPDLIALSVVETTYLLGLSLIDSIANRDIPVIVGGIHAIFSPEEVLLRDGIDMVCIGEGERSLIELCEKMSAKADYTDVKNIWFKNKNGEIIKNEKAPLAQFEEMGFIEPRYDLFEEARFYRPMSGKIYRMLPIEISRGCIYKCTYCSAPALEDNFSDSGKWYRLKSIELIKKEIEYCIQKFDVEYFYMVSETFLAMPVSYFNDFVEMYSEFKIPFWFNTRPETVSKDKIEKLEKIGCHRVSIGVEHGNSDFRTNMLKRKVSNEKIIEACKIMQESSIEFSVNNIIGFPDETRGLIFETIELNRKFRANSHSVSIFQPFRGTWLHKYCVEKKYYDKDRLAGNNYLDYVIFNPYLSREEAIGLQRTFNLYARAPKDRWDEVAVAERLDDAGDAMFEKLKKEFLEG